MSFQTLTDLVDNSITDKNTVHSYLGMYEALLFRKKDAKQVLEIGAAQGGSIKLWHDYFPNATIHAADIDVSACRKNIGELPRVVYHVGDAYQTTSELLVKPIKYDFILDDGSHQHRDMCFFLTYYCPLLADDGVLILEDIPDPKWCEELMKYVPNEFDVHAYDLREHKGRFDDIFLVVVKKGTKVP